MDTQKLDQTYIANTYARFPVTIVKGKGSLVWDDTGKEYIDLSTGIAVDIFGVADEEWMAAVTKQLGTLQHISNLYYTEPCVKLAQMLCEKTGMKKVFFGNSGAEANECAIKAARKWSEEKNGKDYSTIITLKNSFHGRTITTLAATGQDVFHHDFTPLTEGFVYAEPNDLADLEQLIKANKCAAVMMEVVTKPSIAQIAPVSVAISTRCVQPSRSAAHARPSARISRPSASEFRISIVLPEKLVMTSPGTMLESEIRFSQTGTTTVTLTGTPFAASARSAAAAAAPPAISPLIPAIDEAGFRQ